MFVELMLRIAVACARALYALMRLLPVRDRIVMISRQSNRPSRDFRLLAAEWQQRHPSTEIVMLCDTMRPGIMGRLAYLPVILRQMHHLATSRACVLDGYAIPVSVLEHRRGTAIIQIWHALGAIKKFGYQSLDRPSGRPSWLARTLRMHYNYDYVLCGGPASVPVFAEAFGVDPAQVLPLGLPRIDYLLAAAAAEESLPRSASLAALTERHPELLEGDLTTILYAPTFRTEGRPGYRAVAERFLDGPYRLVMRPHDLDPITIQHPRLISATGVNTLALLPLVDIVITDYSAVAFEAALIGKRVYFYVPDIDEYTERHGLNIDPLTTAPSISSRDIDVIARRIESEPYDQAMLDSLMGPYLPTPLAGATERVADLIERAIGMTERP